MERRYCSRCLQTFVAPGPAVCPRVTCALTRPQQGWPGFFSFGDVIDERYRVEEILGAGGAGVTYRCTDQLNGESTAVKVLHGDRKRGTLANRLVIEGEVLEVLDHVHIVPFRALKIVGTGAYYLATLHMRGGSLDRFVRRRGPLTPKGTVVLGRQLALALDYVHAGGIVHRDLKPANVLLEVADAEYPVVRLADFGIARMYRDPRPLLGGLTRTGAFIGTPEYAAPEQIRGEAGIGPAADAFAFGALLHYAASGEALLQRDEIVDWKAFKERDWEPSQRPRLRDRVASETDADRDALRLLDSVIDALMHPAPTQRLDLGMAALRFGANPAQLAPVDQPVFAPATLSGATEEELDAVLASALDPEALVPSDPADDAGETTANLAVVPREPLPGPFAGPSPADDLDDLDDLDDDDVAWPTREQRRNRRHGFFAVAAALLVSTAFAYPGGPGALPGMETVASWSGRAGAVVERMTAEVTTYEAMDAAEAPLTVTRAPLPRTKQMPASETPPSPHRAGVATSRKPDVRAPAETRGWQPQRRPPKQDEPVASAKQATPAKQPTRATQPTRAKEPTRAKVEPPTPARTSPLDAWASDKDDHRTLSDVLTELERQNRDAFSFERARDALAADERAARYLLEAREQDARMTRLRQRWEDAQREAREVTGHLHTEDCED